MKYRFQPLAELYWSVLTAAAVVLLLELAALNPDGIQNWRTWAVALGVAMVRAAAGAGLDWLRRSVTEDQATPQPPPLQAVPTAEEIAREQIRLLREEREQRVREASGG